MAEWSALFVRLKSVWEAMMDPSVQRGVILNAWPSVVGTHRISMPELQAVESVLVDAVAGAIPAALRKLYSEPVTARALEWGEVSAVSEALKWRIFTVDGWLSLEDEYVPRVCAGEHLSAHPEAKAALAIAARTFVLRAMRDHPTLGRTTPVKNGDMFQVFARGASEECVEAAAGTRGFVLQYGGRLILANHVAGAKWLPDGSRAMDQSGTEKWVTYNYERTADDVIRTRLALSTHPGNRGCLSQNGADWLARHGWEHAGILRFFYGDDIEIVQLGQQTRHATSPLFGLAALGMFGLGVMGR